MNIDLHERFWSKVLKTDTCWVWTAAVKSDGRGIFGIGRKSYNPVRVAWFLTYGEWPNQLNHYNFCHNRLCVNPEHVYDGTQKENIQDSVEAGTFRSGRITTAKLTEEQVTEIRHRLDGDTSPRSGIVNKLAKEYGVSHGAISLIRRRINWKDV